MGGIEDTFNIHFGILVYPYVRLTNNRTAEMKLGIGVSKPDAHVKVDRNCCAGVTVETHEAALRTMEMCQVEVV